MSKNTDMFAELVNSLLTADELPGLPDDFKNNEKINRIYEYLVNVRSILTPLARGHSIKNINLAGFLGETINDLYVYMQKCKDVEQALRKSEDLYRRLASIDPLTGMYNRRHFEEMAATEFERMYRYGGKCCVAMADIDYFKIFNDKYGHLAGDQCLRHVAELLLNQVRKIDLCGRYGGEEFIIMFPYTSATTGMLVCERIRAAIENSPLVIDNKAVAVTITIGVTEIRPEEMIPGNIDPCLKKTIGEADKALYFAKNAQRNNVQQFAKINTIVEEI